MIYSKKYTAVKNEEMSLLLTWEPGYRNVRIYDGDRLMKEIDSPGEFKKGISFEDIVHNKVELKFSLTI